MTQHTPGPWITEAQERASRGDVDSGSDVIVVDARDGLPVADCSPEAGYPLTEQHEANARLIAAAPDMLALLERVTPANPFTGPELSGGPACIGCGRSQGNDWHGDPRDTCSWAAARAVIAKAKGEA